MKTTDSLKQSATKHLISVAASARTPNVHVSHKVEDLLSALSDYMDSALNDYTAAMNVADLRLDLKDIADADDVKQILKITGTDTLYSAAQTFSVYADIFDDTQTIGEDELKEICQELDKLSIDGTDILSMIQRLLPLLKSYSVPEIEEVLCEVGKSLRGNKQ